MVKQSIILGPQPGVAGASPASRSISVRPAIAAAVRPLVENNHYLHRWSMITKAYGVYSDNNLVGTLCYGPAGRGLVTRWTVVLGIQPSEITELKRMWLDDCLPANTATLALSKTYGELRGRGIKLIISLADPTVGHTGTVYRAAGFTYIGLSEPYQNDHYTTEGIKIERYGPLYAAHNHAAGFCKVRPRRHIYLFPLTRDVRRDLAALIKPHEVANDAPLTLRRALARLKEAGIK